MVRSRSSGSVRLQLPLHCRNSYWVLQLWLLCVFSPRSLQLSWSPCSSKSNIVAGSVGPNGLMVNLTAICERDMAQLYFNTGGLRVTSLRAGQECTVFNTNETEFEKVRSVSTRKSEENEPNVSPLLSQHLNESDIECRYFGCYYVDLEYYDDVVHRVIFPNATCTFSQVIIPSSSLLITSSSSLLISSPVGSSSLPIVTTSLGSSSSAIISTLEPTYTNRSAVISTIEPTYTNRSMASDSLIVTESWKSPTSKSTVIGVSSNSISTVTSSQPSSGNAKSEWIISAALIAVLIVSIIVFVSCLLFTTKRYFNGSIKGKIYDPNEPFDYKFTPAVHILSPSPSLSGISTSTKLNQLYENEEDLDQFKNILDTPTESAEFSLAAEPSMPDPSESEDKDVQNYEADNMQRGAQSDSEHTYLTDTPRVDNGFVDDQHEMSIFDLDIGYENNGGITELMDDNINIRWLSEAPMPIDIHIPDTCTPQLNSETQSGRLNNGYVPVSMTLYNEQQESLSVTDDLDYDIIESMIIQLDDSGPVQKLEDTSGYVSNDRLQHMDVQQWDQLCQGEEDGFD